MSCSPLPKRKLAFIWNLLFMHGIEMANSYCHDLGCFGMNLKLTMKEFS